MEGKGQGCQGKGREGEVQGGRRRRGGGREGRKVRTPHPSIPAYAPVSRSSDVIYD